MKLVFDIFGVVWQDGGLYTPMLKLLQSYHEAGHALAFASNIDQEQETRMRAMLQPFSREFYCSGSMGVAKPSPLFFNKVTQAMGVDPAQIVFFDDSAANVDSAKACGWQAFLYCDVAATAQQIEESLKV